MCSAGCIVLLQWSVPLLGALIVSLWQTGFCFFSSVKFPSGRMIFAPHPLAGWVALSLCLIRSLCPTRSRLFAVYIIALIIACCPQASRR